MNKRVQRGARAALVVAIAGVAGVAALGLYFAVGQPFGAINDAFVLVMILALAPVMLAHYELGGIVPLWPSRLSLAGSLLAVGAWGAIQVAFIVGLVTFGYDHAATGALAVSCLLQVVIGLWIGGASLLAGRWLPLAVRVLGIVAGIGTVLVSVGLFRSGMNDPLAWLGAAGYLLALPVWAFLLSRVFRARADTAATAAAPATQASPA